MRGTASQPAEPATPSSIPSTTPSATQPPLSSEQASEQAPGSNTKADAAIETSNKSKCPMHNSADGSYTFDWRALFRGNFPHRPGGSHPISEEEARARITRRASLQDGVMASPAGGCPVKAPAARATAAATRGAGSGGGCPVKQQHQHQPQQHSAYNVYSQPLDPQNNMPSSANQLPTAQQSKDLSTDRVSSTIPKGGADEGTTWTYPSPQMFYNALARKKKLGDTDEAEMTSVVALHNNMNEKTWQRVVEWERVVTKEQAPPKLLKFMGRPTDLSPKAVLKHYMLGHPLPYDRHDWTVLRPDGTTVRYVIDYYYDESRAREDASSSMPSLNDTGATPSLLVDVRPALDSPREAWHRIVTMPLAQQQPQGTSYQYLPLAPTNAMKPQVQESVAVWANILAAASGEAASEETTAAAAQPLTPAQARVLVHDFGTAVKACRKQQVKLDKCQNEWECQASSIDYTLCLSQRLCPLQHTAFRKALKADDSGIDSALQIVHDCVLHKTAEHEQTKKDFGL